jgi:DNA modification methylase
VEAKQEETDKKRANDLRGSDWTRYSLSVWRGIKRSAEERALKHPAMFPVALVERLILCFTRASDMRILDPFVGSGSVLVAAKNLGRGGVGLDLAPEFLELASRRLDQGNLFHRDKLFELHLHDARRLTDVVKPNSIDFCVTSPPYWNILTRKRTADYKDIRNYGNSPIDLGRIADYLEFLQQLESVWEQVHAVLRPNKYMVINVMDLRQGPEFIPFHMDVIAGAQRAGFVFDDLIVWDRSSEYNNLRALGYPNVFRINKVHEYLLIFRRRSE